MAQPYVSSLSVLGMPGAPQIMNGIILTAVLSALNSGLFASSRMVMALATRGDAPAALARVNGRGVPARAILLSTAFGYAAVAMNYVSPDHVFAFLVDSYGTVAIFVYMLIALSELRLRARLEREAPERLRLRMWGYPGLTILALVMMVAIVVAMAFIPDQRLPLVFGIVSAAVMLAGYFLRRRFGAVPGFAPGETPRP
jgi:GABA permease